MKKSEDVVGCEIYGGIMTVCINGSRGMVLKARSLIGAWFLVKSGK